MLWECAVLRHGLPTVILSPVEGRRWGDLLRMTDRAFRGASVSSDRRLDARVCRPAWPLLTDISAGTAKWKEP